MRSSVPASVAVSTNIGEQQLVRSTACQAAVGVAVSGADIVKAGLAKMKLKEASYLGKIIVRSVRSFCPGKKIVPVVFADKSMRKDFLDPVVEGPVLGEATKADGVLIDTYDKDSKDGLLDLLSIEEIDTFVKSCHLAGIEAWVAGSITKNQMRDLWLTGVDVICIRGAACARTKGAARFGEVKEQIVQGLAATIPGS